MTFLGAKLERFKLSKSSSNLQNFISINGILNLIQNVSERNRISILSTVKSSTSFHISRSPKKYKQSTVQIIPSYARAGIQSKVFNFQRRSSSVLSGWDDGKVVAA